MGSSNPDVLASRPQPGESQTEKYQRLRLCNAGHGAVE